MADGASADPPADELIVELEALLVATRRNAVALRDLISVVTKQLKPGGERPM